MPYCVDCNREFGATGLFDGDFRSYCPDCTRARKRKEAEEERERRHQKDEDRRHNEHLAADDDRFQRKQELEEERRRDEEMRQYDEKAQAEERERDREYEREARAARAAEERVEALERARLAKIAHEVDAACRASQRKLAAGRANEALEDAERALDQDPNDETALSCAYFAARSANINTAASAFLGRWVARYIARTQSRYQPDSSTSDLLIAEAARSTPGADQLIRSLVDAYRSGPTNLRDALAKVGRSDLFGAWLDVRLKRYFVEKLGFPVESLLEAVAALPDGSARISLLAEHLVEYVSFRAPIAEWLKANGYITDAASYVRSCATGPNAISGFDSVFSEWLIANGYLGDANNYLRDRAPKCDAATRVSTLIPLGIETCRQMKSSTSDWMSMLSADLATLPFARILGSTLKSSVLSSESKDDVIKAMIGHVEHVISGPESYQVGAGLAKAKAGRGPVYSIRSGKELNRPLLDLNAPLVGGVCGLAAWLLPGGTFSVGIVWGALTAAIAWIWTFIYRYRKHEISASIVGRYCSDYSKVLERLGARAQLTAALVSKAPNANPTASLLAALGTIGFLTALVCAGNYFGDNRPGTDLASRGMAGSSAEWIQDWGVATNRTRMTARLGRDSSGPTLTVHDRFCGFCSDGNPLASPDKSPRYTVQIGKCSSEAGRVRCDAISMYQADPSLGAIRTTFELDFLKRSGQLTFYSKDGSTLVNALYDTPSSLSGAPAWLRDQARASGPRDRPVAQSPKPPRATSPIETHIGNIALSRDGQWIAVSRGMAASEQTFAILDAASGKQLAEAVALHGKGLSVGKDKLAISSDSQFVAFAVSSPTNSVPPELYLYSVARGATQYQRALPADMMGICFSADGRRIFTTSGNQLFEFDAQSGRELSRLEFGSRNAYYLASFAAAARVLAVYEDGSNEAAVWDFGGSVSRRRALKTSAKITSIDLSSDGSQLALGDASGAVSLFDTTTGLEILHRDGFGENVLGVRVTPDGRRLAVGVQNGVKVLDIATGDQVADLPHRESIMPWTVSISEDGKKLAAVDGKFRPVFWAVQQ